ncbi:hypothetical protein ACP70R_012165 [Stipagrostis hirtigluma subsp. patula]
MAFWGVEVKPGEPYVHEPGGRLRITQATLDNYEDLGWSMLECNVGDMMRAVRICALNPMSTLMCHLDLEYEEKENFVLSVLGNSSIHLSGFYVDSHNAGHGHCSDMLISKAISHTYLKRKYQGGDTDGKKDGGSPRRRVVCDNGDNGESRLLNPIASSKKKTANKRKCKTPSIEVSNAKKDSMNQVNDQKDFKTMDSSVMQIAPSQAHEAMWEGSALQCAVQEQNAVENKRQNDTADQIIEISDEGAANLQGAEKNNEKADTCGSAYRREDLIVGSADAKMAYTIDKIPCPARITTNKKCLQNIQCGHTGVKNDASTKKPIANKDGDDDDDDHLPVLVAFSKRRAAKKKKRETVQVINDGKNAMDQVNVKRDTKKMESSTVHISPTQALEIAQEDNALQNIGQNENALETNQIIGQTTTIMISDESSPGAANLQGVENHKPTTDDELVIEELKLGDHNAKMASNGKEVCVKYVGWLKNGKIFDRGSKFKFKLGAGRVIRGWDLGISGMRVGGKRRLTIPPALGYGDKTVGNVPANSWLVYEVKLREVQ